MPPLSNLYGATSGYTMITPEAITTATSGAWTTISNSTLATANARLALLSMVMTAQANSSAEEGFAVYLRKTGSGLAVANAQRRGYCTAKSGYSGMGYNDDWASGSLVVEIDLDTSGFDFDYYVGLVSTPITWSLTTYLIGWSK